MQACGRRRRDLLVGEAGKTVVVGNTLTEGIQLILVLDHAGQGRLTCQDQGKGIG